MAHECVQLEKTAVCQLTHYETMADSGCDRKVMLVNWVDPCSSGPRVRRHRASYPYARPSCDRGPQLKLMGNKTLGRGAIHLNRIRYRAYRRDMAA